MFFLIVNMLTSVGIFFWGVKFLTSDKIFSYHEEVISEKWSNLDIKIRFLFITLLRVIGISTILISSIIILTGVYVYFSKCFFVLIVNLLITSIYLGGLFFISFNVYLKTKSNTPWKRMLIFLIVNLICYFLEFIG